MVIFRDYGQAENTSAAIGKPLCELKVKPEFKFHTCCDSVRDRFFETVLPFEFGVRALVVDKSRIYSPYLRDETESFYSYFVRLMMHHDSACGYGRRCYQ